MGRGPSSGRLVNNKSPESSVSIPEFNSVTVHMQKSKKSKNKPAEQNEGSKRLHKA